LIDLDHWAGRIENELSVARALHQETTILRLNRRDLIELEIILKSARDLEMKLNNDEVWQCGSRQEGDKHNETD
jgi:indole-3-glycerol phosphate synthase